MSFLIGPFIFITIQIFNVIFDRYNELTFRFLKSIFPFITIINGFLCIWRVRKEEVKICWNVEENHGCEFMTPRRFFCVNWMFEEILLSTFLFTILCINYVGCFNYHDFFYSYHLLILFKVDISFYCAIFVVRRRN